MSDPRADVALLIDFTDLCQSLMPDVPVPQVLDAETDVPADAETDAETEAEVSADETSTEETVEVEVHVEGESTASPLLPPDRASRIAAALQRFCGDIGRLAMARAYADWSRCAVLARAVNNARLEPVLVPATSDGEDRSHVRLITDALEALYIGDEPDAFVLVTGDPTLLPLVQKLRAHGSEVVIVAPEGTIGEDLSCAADRYVSLERVLAGEIGEPARPRAWRSGRFAADFEDRKSGQKPTVAGEIRRDRPTHPTPVSSEADFDTYSWTSFIKLIDELEHRLPFVGVRYLVNKVLGPHNCGVDDSRLKRDLINRAVDDGLIEMYPVGNVGDRADPVTACRLDRQQELVVDTIGETEPPAPPAENPGMTTGEMPPPAPEAQGQAG